LPLSWVSTGCRANIIPSSRNNVNPLLVKEKQHKKLTTIILFCLLGSVITIVNANLFEGEALSSNITLTLHPDQANAEGNLKATAGTNVEWGGFTWKEVIFSATEQNNQN